MVTITGLCRLPSFIDYIAYVRCVNNGGAADGLNVLGSDGVRPVINLKAGSLKTGSGTALDPYLA